MQAFPELTEKDIDDIIEYISADAVREPIALH